MNLHLYRLSLTERQRSPSLFDIMDASAQTLDRKGYLAELFSQKFSYDARKGIKLTFWPTNEEDGFYAGVFARWRSKSELTDETDPFAPVDGGVWEHSSFYFNSNDDQQVLGIEHNSKVSSAVGPLVHYFTEALNSVNHDGPYKVDARSLNETNDFWEAIAASPLPVTPLKFSFVAPNGPDTEKDTREAFAMLHKLSNATIIEETFKSEAGEPLSLNNDEMKARHSYAAKGGGDTVAKNGKKTIYNSRKRVRTVVLDDVFKPVKGAISGLADALRDILKK